MHASTLPANRYPRSQSDDRAAIDLPYFNGPSTSDIALRRVGPRYGSEMSSDEIIRGFRPLSGVRGPPLPPKIISASKGDWLLAVYGSFFRFANIREQLVGLIPGLP
jgi:hypothetical protein